MTFDEVWVQIQGLPETAKLQIPGLLSEKTKWKLGMKNPAEVAAIVTEAIEDINHGSVERLDELINKKI